LRVDQSGKPLSGLDDPMSPAIIDARSWPRCEGCGLYAIEPGVAVIEVGGINYSPRLQKKPAATNKIYLMIRRVFELGYCRYEWECDALCALFACGGFTSRFPL
jgi:hypothetical protein